jgi:hypothetical protein
MARTTVNVYDMEDTYLQSGAYSAVNYGRSESLMLGYASSYKCKILLRPLFLQDAPPDKKLIHISCKLYNPSSSNPFNSNIAVLKVLEKWSEYVAAYVTCPKVSYQAKALDTAGTFPAGWLEIPLDVFLDDLESLRSYGVALIDIDRTVDGTLVFPSSEVVGENAPHFVLTYADAPELPTQAYPLNGEVVNNSGEGNSRFTWDYHPSPVSLYAQKSYTLQISTDGLTWTDYTETTANAYADIAATSIPSGYFYWRVQTIDTDDVPSDFSDTQLCYGGSAPAAPNITTSVLDKAKPRLEWITSFTQTAYQVKVISGSDTIIDTAAATADQYLDFPVSVASGSAYTVQVRAKNTDGIYSEWASASISASYTAPAKPTFVTVKKNNSIEITVTNSDTVTRNDVYRSDNEEWVCIGSTDEDGIYLDWSVPTGSVTYKVVAVSDTGETESDEASDSFALTSGFLTCVDIPTLEVPVQYNTSWSRGGEYGAELMQFAGRVKPVAEFDEHASRNISLSFETDDADLFSTLEEAMTAKCTMLYRDARIKLYGVCSNITCSNDEYNAVYGISFVLSEIEHDEAVSTE